MSAGIESAIFDALHEYPTGFPVAGSQLAEKLGLSEQTILDTATAMAELPPKYDGLLVVATATEQFTGKPAGFYVSFEPFDTNHPPGGPIAANAQRH